MPESCLATAADHLVINEIQLSGQSADDEFIEIYNPTSETLNLSTWSLQYRGGESKSYSKKNFETNSLILPGDYFLIAHGNKYTSAVAFDMSWSQSLSSEGGTIFLVKNQTLLTGDTDGTDLVQDKVAYGKGSFLRPEKAPLSISPAAQKSLGRKNSGEDTNDNSSDFIIFDQTTPKAENILIPKEPKLYKLRLNEILPNPKESPESSYEYVEIYNFGEEPVDLSELFLKDKTSSKRLAGIINPGQYAVLSKTVSLSNSGETLALEDADKNIVSLVSYQDAREDVSYNFDGALWRWSRFLTPKNKNKFNHPPQLKIQRDKNFFVQTYGQMEVKTNDSDKDNLKITWDFGDGHKSYLKKTRHKYAKAGKYFVQITVFDGSEKVQEAFELEVKKYPESEIKIVKFKANPKGKDTDKKNGEEIYLKNKSSKKVNLKNWSLATGTKKLVNHPITKDFIIPPGKTKKLTRKYSLFTLPNKKGKVELRYPNGEVAARVKYDKKKESIQEEEVYELYGKDWKWNAPNKEVPTEENTLLKNSPTFKENPEAINLETKLEVSEEEISLNLGNYSTENKLAWAEIGFWPALQNPSQNQEVSGVVLGAFATPSEFKEPTEVKPLKLFEKFFQKSNSILNFLLNQFSRLI